MKLVIDADCIVAGTLAKAGAAARLLDLWRDGAFEVIACPHLVEEICAALLTPRIAERYGITKQEVDELSLRLREEAIWLADPVDPPRVVPLGAGDDYLVALARAGEADALVRRDRHFDGVSVPGLRIAYSGDVLEELL